MAMEAPSFQLLDGSGLTGVNAERLVVHIECSSQIRAVLLVEVVQVRSVLEVVCIQITVNQCGVRLHIVGELNNIQV